MDRRVAYKKVGFSETTDRNFQANMVEVQQKSFFQRIKQKFYQWIRLSNEPTVKVYHGYGHARNLHVFGQVLALSPVSRKKYRRNIWTNSFALLRSFMVKPMPRVLLKMQWMNNWVYTRSEDDGFFVFDLEPLTDPEPGWQEVEVFLIDEKADKSIARGTGLIYLPPKNRFGCISDIDDTFLISHSARLFKKLYVLLTRNAHSRKPFDGVVNHYQLLAQAGSTLEKPNPFFYVSSSEWNLYDFITEFARKNQMPAGIYLLNQLKKFSQILKTGQGKHNGKFMRIVRIMQAFPHMRFILLGDSSQRDPYIYASIAEHFPSQVHAIYIRDVYKKNQKQVGEILERMEKAGIPCCFFTHSKDAVLHSQRIGLIPMGNMQ
jgi:phosphatidate phosphatase APP1